MTGEASGRAILDPTMCALWPDQLDAVEQLNGWRNQTLLMQIVNDAVVVIDLGWCIRRWNPAAEAIYGWKAAEVIGKQIDAIIPVARYCDGGSNEAALAALARTGTWRGEVVQPHRDGHELCINSLVWLICDEAGKPLGMIAINRDVTQQRRIEEQQRLLSRRLVLVQETERASLARELHDEIGQALTGLKIMLDLADTAPYDGTSALHQARLADARTIVSELTEHVRELSHTLHPAILDDLGLLPALLWLVGRYTNQTMIEIDLRHNGLNRRFAPEVETVVYRVVQEALTNIARHAHAPAASVQILAERELLLVRVEDRGCGFDPALLSSPNSYGLCSMRERVALVGGRLSIEARPGIGTCLIAELPFGGQHGQLKERAV